MTWRSRIRNAAVALATGAIILAAVTPVAAAGPAVHLANPLRAASEALSGAQLAVGRAHTCAVVNGGIECWGDNSSGQLGDGTTTDRRHGVPVLASLGGAPLGGATAVAAGAGFTCAIVTGGTVKCWGSGTYGQLGNGRTARSSVPVVVTGITGAVLLSAGTSHACAVLGDGSVRCWGRNQHGQLGDGTRINRTRPVAVRGLAGVTAVAAGGAHTCAVAGATAKVRCWGANTSGQLGDGSVRERLLPVAVAGLDGSLAIIAGDAHTCVVLPMFDFFFDGYDIIACWGSNAAGQTDPSTSAPRILRPDLVQWTTGFRGFSAGARHTCVSTDEWSSCWGANASGQLGDGSREPGASEGVAVLGLVDGIAAGGSTTCAMVSNEVFALASWCWGENGDGQVGDGTTRDRVVPTTALQVSADPPLPALRDILGVAVGTYHSCSIAADRTVRCWGDNSVAELGDGTAAIRASASTVRKLTGAQAIATGLAHTCALTETGAIRCWGYNYTGQLGDGTVNHRSAAVPVHGITGALSIGAGEGHTCAVLGDRSVACWGDNDDGQLGDGSIRQRLVPVAVAGLANVNQVAPGDAHTCALIGGGSVACWGANDRSQLGDGTTAPHRLPAPVSGIADAVAIASGSGFSCALRTSGVVTCWGVAPGRPPEAFPDDPEAALPAFDVPGISGASAIAVGAGHACALLGDGSVRCWGANELGQLGNGTTAPSDAPVTVAGLTDATAIAAGGDHTCARRGADNGVVCWGSGGWYELGNGLPARSARPVTVVAR